MFDLGRSLRDARRQRGVELDAAQRATHIRRRYLEALEDERFDMLPAPAYARGFLREYAEFLGLDGDLYVAEYDDRFAPHEELVLSPISLRMRTRVVPGGLVVVVLALVAVAIAVVAIGLGAWSLRSGSRHKPTTSAAITKPATHHVQRHVKHRHATHPARPPKPLVLTAARGDCWISVRVGSSAGRVVYERILPQGATISFGLRRPLVLRVGAGANLDARANGRTITLPHLVGDIVVTRRGVG